MERLCLCQHKLSKHTCVRRHAHRIHTRTPSPLTPAPELIAEPLPASQSHIHVKKKRLVDPPKMLPLLVFLLFKNHFLLITAEKTEDLLEVSLRRVFTRRT